VGLSFGMGATNESLLLLGFADQVAGAVRLLQQSDRPLKERSPEMYEWQQTVQSLQNSITDLQTRLATAQKQIAELQKASTEGRK
jgi:peptidoglycan hydrolase CwlO-like protein